MRPWGIPNLAGAVEVYMPEQAICGGVRYATDLPALSLRNLKPIGGTGPSTGHAIYNGSLCGRSRRVRAWPARLEQNHCERGN
jgi:hypothetical protein